MSSRDDGRRRIGFLQLCLYRAYSDWRPILLEEWPMDGPRTDRFQALPSGCDFATRPYGVRKDQSGLYASSATGTHQKQYACTSQLRMADTERS